MYNDISEKLINSLKESISNNLGEYVILGPLSRGSEGFVFRIRDRKNQKEYALKVIWKDANKKGADAKIKNEISIHQSLRSQYIIQLLTKFQDFENYYIVVEYCSEGDLAKYMKSGGFTKGLPHPELKSLSLQIAKGINYLHDNTVIHRDLKPQNILITSDRRAKICDFGYSIKTGDKMKDIIGTLNYLAPEIVSKREYDNKVDIWAFGCILFAMATGDVPFKCQNFKDAMGVKGDQLVYPIHLDPYLVDLLKKIFVNDPEERLDIKKVLAHKYFCPQESNQSLKRASSSRFLPIAHTQVDDQKLTARVSSVMLKPQIQKQNVDINRLTSEGHYRRNSPIDAKLTARNHIKPHSSNPTGRQFPKDLKLKLQENKPVNSILSPIRSRGLRPTSIETQHGRIRIDQNGFTNQSHLVRFNVSPDGNTIRISKNNQQKSYPLTRLPVKYQGRYQYCKEVIKIMMNNYPKVKLQNRKGKFILMQTGRFVAELPKGKIELLSCSPGKESDTEDRQIAKKYYKILSQLTQ